MPCLTEKLSAGIAGAGVAAGGVGLIQSSATGPAFFIAVVGWLASAASYLVALNGVADCLERNGHPEMAMLIREKRAAIEREIADFSEWARSLGAQL